MNLRNGPLRRTKIVCTLGPATDNDERVLALMQAGMDVARLNFSHGTHADHAERFRRIRRAAEQLGRPVAIMQDLQGPRIRTGALVTGEVRLTTGATLTITTDDVVGNDQVISTTYQHLPLDVRPGNHLLLADGRIDLQVLETNAKTVHCLVVNGGRLGEHQGINLPGVAVSAPALSDKDRDDLAFGLQLGIDYVALSFVRSPDDVIQAREFMQRLGSSVPIIAKLEKPEAMDRLEEILSVADGVMVARGDLGVEAPPERVPFWQKQIIREAARLRVPVVTATQMLESMITNPRPTRAEVSDVANAIFDGTDAVMLSGETAIGEFPLDAVQMMARIAVETEMHLATAGPVPAHLPTTDSTVNISGAAWHLIEENLSVAAIACFTRSGWTARVLSKNRPRVPILAFTSDDAVYRRMALLWGVIPRRMPQVDNLEQLLERIEELALEEDGVRRGDLLVVVGNLSGQPGAAPDFLKLHHVGG